MKNCFIALILLLAVSPAFAQSDLSFWNRYGCGENLSYPWYTYFGPKIVVDARYNFDQKKTAGIYAGKMLGGKKFTAIPTGGALFGKYNGISPQIYFMSSAGRFNYFSQHQYVKGIGSHDFQYHWIDILVTANKHLSAGVDWQIYHEWRGNVAENDIGPSAKYVFGPVRREEKEVSPYLRIWYAKSVGPANKGADFLYAAVGVSF